MAIERIKVLGVPVDVCTPEDFENEILELLARPGAKQIVFLSVWGLLNIFLFGLFFASLTQKTGSILPACLQIRGS